MSVIVEFSLSTEDFVFGSALATAERMDVELEAIVPTGDSHVPYFWVTGEDFEAFERHAVEESKMTAIVQLDRIEDTALYRVEWEGEMDRLLEGLEETRGVVLEAMTREGGWYFQIRFPDHDSLARFSDICTEEGIEIDVERVYRLAETPQTGRSYDLTEKQREALLLAIQHGYFEVPRGITLTEIADELGITQQAASQRVRRGADKVLGGALLSSSGE